MSVCVGEWTQSRIQVRMRESACVCVWFMWCFLSITERKKRKENDNIHPTVGMLQITLG